MPVFSAFCGIFKIFRKYLFYFSRCLGCKRKPHIIRPKLLNIFLKRTNIGRLRVKNIRYYASQPWGITAGGLLLGYWCDVDGDSEIHVDGEEIADGAWFRREDLAEYKGVDHPSLTSEMIAVFASGEKV